MDVVWGGGEVVADIACRGIDKWEMGMGMGIGIRMGMGLRMGDGLGVVYMCPLHLGKDFWPYVGGSSSSIAPFHWYCNVQ